MKERSWTEKGLSPGSVVGGILAFFFVCDFCPQWPCVFLWSCQCYITGWWHIGLLYGAWEFPSALSSLNVLWKSEETWNCCQARLRETKLERFGRGGQGLCSQAVIQSDRAQRWKGKDEGNRSNGVLTNEKSWLGICECSSHTDTHKRMHTHFGIARSKGWHTEVKCRLCVCLFLFCPCVCVCCRVVQVRLMLAPDLQARGNKQQSRQEARCNSTNF